MIRSCVPFSSHSTHLTYLGLLPLFWPFDTHLRFPPRRSEIEVYHPEENMRKKSCCELIISDCTRLHSTCVEDMNLISWRGSPQPCILCDWRMTTVECRRDAVHYKQWTAYLWLVLMYLHSRSHCSLYVVPLRFRGVKNFDWMGSPRYLSSIESIGVKKGAFRDEVEIFVTLDHTVIKLKFRGKTT